MNTPKFVEFFLEEAVQNILQSRPSNSPKVLLSVVLKLWKFSVRLVPFLERRIIQRLLHHLNLPQVVRIFFRTRTEDYLMIYLKVVLEDSA